MSSLQSFVTAIKETEATTKKEPKIAALSKMDAIGQRLVMEAQNPYRVFGVKKYPKIKSFAEVDASAEKFIELLDKLHNRELTGNDARDAVVATLASYTEETSNYLSRVLNKDMKAGFSENTTNRCFPGLVPVFDIMLATKMDEKYKWKWPCQGEYKMDGTRLISITEHGATTYFSRGGRPSDFCNGLFDEELADFEKYVGEPIVVDGEALGDSFIETLNAKSSDGDEAKKKLRLFAFDWMTLREWKAQQCGIIQSTRSETLANIVKVRQYKKIVKSKSRILNNLDEATEFYKQALEDGFEGLIIKDPDGLYVWGRDKSWTKWKPVFDFDLTVTGVYEGKEGTKNEGRMGGFECEGTDENGNFIVTRVGSLQVGVKGGWLDGYIQELAKKVGIDLATAGRDNEGNPSKMSNDEFFRTYVFQHPEEFIGRTAQLEAQELSQAEGSETYSLRFPVLVMFRDDR